RAVFPVKKGNRTFKWRYSKDFFMAEGEDCGWVDNIVFPPTSLISGLPKSFSDISNIKIHLYPNPAVDVLNISFELNEKTNLEAIIYNAIGQQIRVIQPSAKFSGGAHQFTSDLSDLKNGIYFVVLKTETQIISRHFLLLK
ncbi:MAG: T9SS type A sorting domain-containing protein, partial [Flavobacterium sp.]|nr:T9SS type A sorting domain-containing protein [Flavobacterium sp.]